MVHVMHVLFMFFAVFKNLKSSFSEDNMPVHALDIFIENATKMVGINLLNTKFKVAPKLCIFLHIYNAMETTGVCQGMGIIHSDVMGYCFP